MAEQVTRKLRAIIGADVKSYSLSMAKQKKSCLSGSYKGKGDLTY